LRRDGRNLGCAAVEAEGWPAAGFADDLDLKPVDAVADACSQGFRSSLLGGEAGSKAFGRIALAQAIGLFRGSVDAIEKAAAVAIHGLLDAPDLSQIDA